MSLDLENQIVDTWNINNRINLYLLEAIPPGALNDASASKGRTVAQQLAHLHNVRLMRGFKPHITAFLGYVDAHESHHRGQIALSLKQSGHTLDKKVAYGIWEWGVR